MTSTRIFCIKYTLIIIQLKGYVNEIPRKPTFHETEVIFMEIYIVQQGDTVSSIAARFGVSPQRIIADNSLALPDNLAVGQALLILIPEVVHTVRRGETLESIARDYGTTVRRLRRNNLGLTSREYIYDGETIVISYENERSGNLSLSGFVYPGVNRNILRQVASFADYTIIFGYGFDTDGTLIIPNDSEVISISKQFGSKVLLSLSLINADGSFYSGKLAPLLNDIGFQDRVLSQMIDVIKRKGADGMDIDMEYIPAAYKDGFSAFVQNAADRLHAERLVLNIDLAPKTSADQQGTLYESHDYPSLGASTDLAFLMTYEWGYQFGPPLAIAPINKVREVVDYAIKEIPLEKIYLGMPNYAYDWTLPFIQGESAAEVIGNRTAAARAAEYNAPILYDEIAQSPYYNYSDGEGREHIVWFEDVRSVKAKLDLIREYSLRGAGIWNFMRAFPQAYLLMENLFELE